MRRIDQEEEITAHAEGLSEDYFPDDRVDPEQIARSNGITVSFGDYGEAFDGMLEHRTGRFHIYCNSAQNGGRHSARSRFTLCHELGHYFIDDHRNALATGAVPPHQSVCDFRSQNMVERQADLYAASLLMPSMRFRSIAARVDPGMDGVLELARTFGSSRTSAAIRRVRLLSDLCVLMKWTPDGYVWKHLSSEAYGQALRKTVEDLHVLAPESATSQALSSSDSESVFRVTSTASAWFPFISPGSPRDQIMLEESIRLGEHGVLTLLRPHPQA